MTAKRHDVLDGLRGVCALAVMTLHFCESYRYDDIVPHAHLAVEFFFILTGFTFVLAYDGRWRTGELTLGKFLWRRFVRLWPLVVIGSFVGLLFCFWMSGTFPGLRTCQVGDEIGRFLYSLTMLPQTTRNAFLTPMQPQTWTLLYIIYANVIYALLLRHLKTPVLAVAAALAAGYSGYVAWHCHSFALGWAFNEDHVTVACARMAFPVLAGMLVARRGWRLSFRGAGAVAVLVLCFFLYAPVFRQNGWAFGWYELAAVLVGIPLVLLTASGCEVGSARLSAVCRFLGRYSFPLYATHFAFREPLAIWVREHPDAPFSRHAAVVFAVVVAALALGWVAMCADDALGKALKRIKIGS